jgi:DNA-binding NtrC family response regulator
MKGNLQAKLLRVIQEREVEQVGGIRPIKVDVRIIAATHQNLEELVAAGRFREDLYYRLAVIPLVAPPLCERKNDLELLIERFIERFSRRKTDRRTTIDAIAMKSLQNYSWPGNVRELENLMQRLVILHRGKRITLRELPEKYRCVDIQADDLDCAAAGGVPSSAVSEPPEAEWSDTGLDFNGLISEFEDRLILQALSRTGGNKKEAARMLNLKRTTLIEKIKKKNLPV